MAIKQRVFKISPSQDETCDPRSKSAAFNRASELQASLPSQLPSFIKSMLPSQVTRCFWLGLPKRFCDLHMPKHDETIVLVDEDDQEFNTKYLAHKTGLSGGWGGFANAHKLLPGDALVFQLIDHWKFRVYIVRVCGSSLNETDGALGLLNLVSYGHQNKNDSTNLRKAEDMDIDSRKQNDEENSLVVFDQSEDNNDYADSPDSEGLRFSQSVLKFKEIKNIDDFSIVVDGLIIDSEIPKHFQIKYYDLCRSQKTYLHENLLKGLNVKLAVGVILETVTIADAIRACKVSITRDDFDIWDRTLKAFEEMGMKVGFLRGRISKLVGLLFDSNKLLEAKKNERRVMNKKLCDIRDVIKNLDVEIETLKLTGGKNLELVFCKEANAPW
ncbi:putative transcription factor B3-Domain family [Helianthus annuus]|nr:putative transcription factor B3-Domain family [Helianthus annuus]